MEVRGDVLKSLEAARNEKLIGAPLEAHVRLLGRRRPVPAAASDYARELPSLFIVSQVSLDDGGADAGRDGGARRGRQVRALLEVHRRRRLGRRSPTICAPCAAAVKEMSHG